MLQLCVKLLSTGCTAICPTIVSSAPETYAQCIGTLRQLHTQLARLDAPGGDPAVAPQPGCRLLGLHLEGPFINPDKKGAHALHNLRVPSEGMTSLAQTYGDVDWNGGEAAIVTLAPELPGALGTAHSLAARGVVVSIGHTSADIRAADAAVHAGCTLITHLYNAMSSFHHRDPGVVGLLGRMHGGVKPKAHRRMSRQGSNLASLAICAQNGSAAPADDTATPLAPTAPFHTPGTLSVDSAIDASDVPSSPAAASVPMSVTLHEEGHIVPSDTAVQLASAPGTPSLVVATAAMEIGVSLPHVNVPHYHEQRGSSDGPTSRDSAGLNGASGDPQVAPVARTALDTLMRRTVIPGPLARLAGKPAPISSLRPAQGFASPAGSPVAPAPSSQGNSIKPAAPVTPFTPVPRPAADGALAQTPRLPLSDGHGRPFYSIIVDGVHCHPYAVCTAMRTHPAGLILVTDAMKAMGLPVGRHTLGEFRSFCDTSWAPLCLRTAPSLTR